MANGKYKEPGWIRLYITIGGFIVAAVLVVSQLMAHSEDKVKHMTMSERQETALTDYMVDELTLEVRELNTRIEKMDDKIDKGFIEILKKLPQ